MNRWSKGFICFSILALVGYTPFRGSDTKEHPIIFCGEYIPVDNDFVANKLMSVIKSQVNYVNMPSLRASAAMYFDYVKYQLQLNGIPEDFKYLPIVESGFRLVSSGAGARGFWQLMPETAKGLGLRVDNVVDERDDIEKSTKAACRVLKDYYQYMLRRHKKASWVLTAAAYNIGIGNMSKAVSSQGDNYFTMRLNSETALYVYKIIAIKELFEFPEVYMKNFGYNILTTIRPQPKNTTSQTTTTANTKPPPEPIISDSTAVETLATFVNEEKPAPVIKPPVIKTFVANITGKYKKFKDGDLVHIKLQEDLEFPGFFRRAGNEFIGSGWILEDRVYVELPYGHSLQLFDQNFKKGISLNELKDEEPVVLKLTVSDDVY
jgi:membrane-bound lytic murein transglycosylase D